MQQSKGGINFLKKQRSIYMIVDIFLNGITFSLFFYMSWMFPQEAYGKLNALLSFLALTYVLGFSYQIYVTKVVNSRESNYRDIVSSAKRIVLVLTIPFLLLNPFLSNVLQTTPLAVGIIGLITCIAIFLSLERGIMQGQERFIHLAISLCIDIGIKILIVVPLLLFTSSIPLVLFSTLLGHIGAFIFCKVINKPHYELETIDELKTLRGVYLSIWSIITAQFFFSFFNSIDMVVVNWYLNEMAGIYAVTIKIGQLHLIFGTALVYLWFPKMVRSINDGTKIIKTTYKWLGIVLAFGCTIALFYQVWVSKWLSLFLPEDYIEIQNYLGFSSLIYTFLLISVILTNLLIAYDSKGYIKIFACGAIVYIFLTLIFHDGLLHIMFIQLLTYLLMAILLFYHFIKLGRKEAKLQ
ncbi:MULTISPECIES: hypothetical protein [Lysinibacillus]|uniref:Polysaccharide biosynthesis protein n=1 Tax=Lysinibacillus antri TaxID=2498145 RepID=A0A432LBB1_9BACI|nr:MULTISPECIES: hypothetical protein [Lysinibacillus]RUL52007.1 hypothetical protein EK386_10445 [Lysinibacillus antri]TSI05940.1 hypothetical protein FJQ64_11060 [Lysinibacillus sp. BW-2-10]